MKCTHCLEPLPDDLPCPSCGRSLALDLLLEREKLVFLLAQTQGWAIPAGYRMPYEDRLRALNRQLPGNAPEAAPATVRVALSPVEVRPAPTPAPESGTAEPAPAAAGPAAAAPAAAAPVATAPVAAAPTPAAPAAAAPVAAAPTPAAPAAAAPVAAAPVPAAPAAAAPTAGAPVAAMSAEVTPARAPAERVPFDQWLLSERNIKLALYAGGLLLVLAGLIFVSANWARIPGSGKFVVTLSMTGLMFLGGLALYRRPTLRIGGFALLAVAGGFLPLNLVALQFYVLDPAGVDPDLTIVLGSAACLPLYILMARWLRSALFATFAVLALVIGVAYGGDLLPAAIQDWWGLVYMLVAHLLLALAGLNRRRAYIHWPFFVSAQLLAPVVTMGALAFYFGNPESVSTSALCVLFYVLTDFLWGWRWGRWLAAGAAFWAYIDLLIALGFELEDLPKGWMLLSLVYLAVGYVLHRSSGRFMNGLAFYLGGAGLAVLVTFLAGGVALFELFSRGASVDLALALILDTILLLLATAVSRKWYWLYGAVWLFILPAGLILYIQGLGAAEIGLGLGVLALLYTLLGYLVGRRSLVWAGAFLSAAAGLSAFSVAFAWEDPRFAGLLLAGFGALYLLVARWLRWSFLLLPAWLALDLLLAALSRLMNVPGPPAGSELNAAIFVSGPLLVTGSALIRRAGSKEWAWPLLLGGVVNIGLAYWSALMYIGGWYALTLSAFLVAFGLIMAWTEYRLPALLDSSLSQLELARIITFVSLGISFILLYWLLYLGPGPERFSQWAPLAALYCSALLLLSRLIRRQPHDQIYGLPMQLTGLTATPFALLLSLASFEPLTVAATFLIAGLAYGAHWLMKRNRYGIYLSVGLLVVVFWALLVEWDVSEVQAYVIPLGLLLLAVSQVERRAGRKDTYALSMLAGLALLFTLLAFGGWYALTLSAFLVTFGLIMAWTEYRLPALFATTPSQLDLARIFTFLSLGVSFILLFWLLVLGTDPEHIAQWAPLAALYCSALLLLSRLIRRQPHDQIYGSPMQLTGLAATPFALLLSLASFEPRTVTATFLIAGLAYGVHWLMKQNRYGIYLSVGLLVVAFWALLMEGDVSEVQAYVIPLGLLLLAVSQVERRAGRKDTYALSTLAGLGLLMGTALLQSLGWEGWLYPLLLLLEGLLATVVGIRTHSRIYVQVGVLGLVINSVIQLGPAFLRLPSWVHLAVAGVLLLGGGLLALFRRETIIALRSEVGEAWKDWNP